MGAPVMNRLPKHSERFNCFRVEPEVRRPPPPEPTHRVRLRLILAASDRLLGQGHQNRTVLFLSELALIRSERRGCEICDDFFVFLVMGKKIECRLCI
jgi:hypothetical protein